MTQLPPEHRRGPGQPYRPETPAASAAPRSRRELREHQQRQEAEAERRRIAEAEERRAEEEWRAEQEWKAEQERRAEQEWRAREAQRAEQERRAELEWRAQEAQRVERESRRGDDERMAQTAIAHGEERVRSGAGRPAQAVADPDAPEPDLLFPWDDDPAPRPSRADRRASASLDLDEHETEPRRRKRRGAMGCLVALVVLVAVAAGAWFFFLQAPVTAFLERFEPAADYSGSGSGEVVFMINEGDGGQTIAANLEEEGVVASAEAFVEEVTSRSSTPTFYPGAYRLASEMSAKSALDALLDPANKLENTFVIQEGLWARDAFAAASAATGIPVEELQAAAADPQALGLPEQATSVEGFLFPATYTFPPDVTADQVVKTLVDRTFQALDEAGVPAEQRWETIVVASLIEREAGSADDSYKVSRVIRNRLDPAQFESGLLQFDSTVHYGIGDDSTVETSDAERADPGNPYNTYVHPGLPPGPIGNPGDVAIDAALNPADGPWLYFVTVNLETGETVFSATLAEHEAAVQQFLQYLEENG